MSERFSHFQKQWIIRRLAVLLGVGIMLGAFCAIYINMSLGWFSSNKDVSGTGMSVGISSSFYELAVSGEQVSPLADNSSIVTYLSSNAGIQKLSETDPSNVAILCHMSNENPHITGSEVIAPGSYGTVSFDIVLKKEYEGSFDIALDFLFYGVDGSNRIQPVAEGDVSQLKNLLSGHILFFQTRGEENNGGHYYSDRIIDGVFEYDLSEHTGVTQEDGTHYTVEFYWIWPATFGRLALTADNGKLHGHALFDDEACRAEMISMIQDQPECFFVNLDDAVDLDHAEFENYYYVELSDGYNEGDQFIGDRVRYLVLLTEANPK